MPVLLTALVAALAASPPALARESRHILAGKISGTAKCPLAEPTGVAVNGGDGEVFVVEGATHHVERFSASGGECLSSWSVPGAGAIAVDNSAGPSHGDVYVAAPSEKESEERYKVDKYTPEGKLVGSFKRFKVGKEEFVEFEELGEILGLAVDDSGRLWVYTPEAITGFSGEVKNDYIRTIETFGNCSALTGGFAVNGDASRFFVSRERERRNGECESDAAAMVDVFGVGELPPGAFPGEPAIGEGLPYAAELDGGPVEGAAVDSSTQSVYFDNGTNISQFDGSGKFVERFGEAGEGQLTEGHGLAVDTATKAVYAADWATETVNVYLPAGEAPPAKLEPEPPKLADNRQYELVTPPLKHGAAIEPNSSYIGIGEVSPDGNTIVYDSSAPLVEDAPSNRSPEVSVNLARRGSGGWSAPEDLDIPREKAIAFSAQNGYSAYHFFSEDLTSGFLSPDQGLADPHEPELSPVPSETTLYRRDLTRSASSCVPIPSSCYQALVSSATTPATGYGAALALAGVAPDGHHAIFRELAEAPLAGPAPGQWPLYEWSEGEGGGSLQQINVLPAGEGGAVLPDAYLGEAPGEGAVGGEEQGNFLNSRNAISSDGTKIFWSSGDGEPAVYVRDTAKQETLRIDVPEAGLAPEESNAVFRIASVDGSSVFFTDSARLTKDSTVQEEQTPEEEGHSDLFVCELKEEDGKLACGLKDLTTSVLYPGESASVQSVVGASEDGSYVYFVADGALATGAGRGRCDQIDVGSEQVLHTPPTSCNLYVVHRGTSGWESPRFIARLTSEDRPDWSEAWARLGLTSRVSPDGRYAAFMSTTDLTGYDNIDATSGVPDEEVFIYSYAEDRVRCVSCDPSKQPPHGVLDRQDSGEGNGLVMDPEKIWDQRWLAGLLPGYVSDLQERSGYLTRNLNDNGQLFFDAVDGLAPADTNGKADVYEYEPDGQGSCASATGCVSLLSGGTSEHESTFWDASKNGSDVFLYTAARLTSQDIDGAFDIYDAHACTSESPCSSPSPPAQGGRCAEEPSEASCRQAPTTVAAEAGAPPSASGGSGNHGELRVLSFGEEHLSNTQKLERALKQCRKKRNKKKRRACERQARKRYPVKKGKKSSRARRARR